MRVGRVGAGSGLGAYGRRLAGGGRGLRALLASGRRGAGHLQSAAHLPVPIGRDALGLGHHVLLRGACRPSGPGHARTFALAGGAVPVRCLRARACGGSPQARRAEVLLPVEAVRVVRPVCLRLWHAGKPVGGGRGTTLVGLDVHSHGGAVRHGLFRIEAIQYRASVPVARGAHGVRLSAGAGREPAGHGGIQLSHRHQLLAHVLPRDVSALRHRQASGRGHCGVHGHQERRAAVADGRRRRPPTRWECSACPQPPRRSR